MPEIVSTFLTAARDDDHQQGPNHHPQAIRAALNLHEGDALGYELDEQRVILTKVQTDLAVDDPFRTFSEWYSDANAKAFADL